MNARLGDRNTVASVNSILVPSRSITRNWQVADPGRVLATADFAQASRIAAAYETIIQRDRYCDVCWHNLAWLELGLDRKEDAVSAIKQAIWLAPDDPMYMASAGLIYEVSKRNDLAVRYYAKEIEMLPRSLGSPQMKALHSRNPLLEEQAIGLAIVDMSNVSDPASLARRGQLRIMLKDTRSAEEDLATATSEMPSLTIAWKELAFLDSHLHKPEEARRAAINANLFVDSSEDDNRIPGNLDEIYKPWDRSPHYRRAEVQYLARLTSKNDLIPGRLLASVTTWKGSY